MRDGERRGELADDSIMYAHRGVVYGTKDGVGIWAYREEPEQCVCRLAQGGAAAAVSSAAIAELQAGMIRAQTDCVDCLGCPRHRTSTDAVATFLEQVDWSKPKFRGLFSEPYVRGLLLLMAAGSLLVPVQCAR